MDLHKKLTAVNLTDDLVVDILSRLTYKSFCRCKCAYKAWSAFSSDPDYREKLPKKVTTGLLYQGHNKSAILLVSLCPDDGEIDGILADVPHYGHLEFLDCCNGLVLWILHYALPHENGCSIVVWTLDDFGQHSWTWTKMCHLSMTDAFGKDEFVHYDDGGDGGEDKWFWNCDYRIVDLDLERGLVFLHDQKANKLLSYNISGGKLNEIQDAFGWDRYYVYVPCYSELPAQEPSVQ
uniref:F-box domain-containing protein n=1 Tax=Aegilops tauschii TaxID=37682 RepID=M8C207_AEGTA